MPRRMGVDSEGRYIPDGLTESEWADIRLREIRERQSKDFGAWGPRFKKAKAPFWANRDLWGAAGPPSFLRSSKDPQQSQLQQAQQRRWQWQWRRPSISLEEDYEEDDEEEEESLAMSILVVLLRVLLLPVSAPVRLVIASRRLRGPLLLRSGALEGFSPVPRVVLRLLRCDALLVGAAAVATAVVVGHEQQTVRRFFAAASASLASTAAAAGAGSAGFSLAAVPSAWWAAACSLSSAVGSGCAEAAAPLLSAIWEGHRSLCLTRRAVLARLALALVADQLRASVSAARADASGRKAPSVVRVPDSWREGRATGDGFGFRSSQASATMAERPLLFDRKTASWTFGPAPGIGFGSAGGGGGGGRGRGGGRGGDGGGDDGFDDAGSLGEALGAVAFEAATTTAVAVRLVAAAAVGGAGAVGLLLALQAAFAGWLLPLATSLFSSW